MSAQVDVLARGAAGDEGVVQELAGLVNRAYAVGESGLWREGAVRIAAAEVAAAIAGGDMLVATVDGRVAGCAHVRRIDPATADLGLVSADPAQQGRGVGRALVRHAEELMRDRGVAAMQLELLVPVDRPHPQKERLRAWYGRLGYRVVRTAPFEAVAGQGAARPVVPCHFLVFSKPLAGA